MKLNFGGVNIRDGFKIVNLDRSADIQWDLNNYPLPFRSRSVTEIRASHILEHLKEPLKFLEECYRIMKPEARMLIKVPHWTAAGSYSTMEHRYQFDETAINSVVGFNSKSIFPHMFRLISTKVNCGKYLFWRKYEIEWVIER